MGQASNHRATIANVRGDDVSRGLHHGNTNFDFRRNPKRADNG
jgi:hypothetical protein